MKQVLIVEDEVILRQGIISLINWAELGCKIKGECADGNEAVKFLEKNKVDIVITDIKMPGMDGLQLSKYIKENFPSTEILLLTAYSSFEYAQTAIKIGVYDYVVKTSFITELPETIKRVVKHIDKTQKENSHQNEDIIKSLVFSGILEGMISSQSDISLLISNYKIDLNNYCVVLSEPIFKNKASISDDMQNFKKIHDLAFKDFDFFSVWIKHSFLMNIIFFSSEEYNKTLLDVEMVCKNFLNAAENLLSFSFNMAQSSNHKKPQQLILAYQEALSCINRTIDKKIFIRYKENEKPIESDFKFDVSSSVDILIKNISNKKNLESEVFLQNLFSTYSKQDDNLEKVKVDMLLLISALFDKLSGNDLNLPNVYAIEQNYNCRILACRSLSSLFSDMCIMINELSNMDIKAEPNGNYLVQLVNTIIREKYNTSIRLEDMASMLHVNSSYLSRLYKKETGKSLITTLNKFRINKAKELLKTGEHKIAEVASMVGIEDPAYFTNVFTKYTGKSPKNYR